MKILRLSRFTAALLLSLSTLLSVAMPLAHAAVSTCTWTDASGINNFYSDNNNWSCTGSSPSAATDTYNLIFPQSSGGFAPIDDITSLSVGTITFNGTFTGAGYQIVPDDPSDVMTISGGITDNSTGAVGGNEIDGDIVINGSQSFTAGTGTHLTIGAAGDTLGTGSSTLTLANTTIGSSLTNSGSLIVNDSLYPSASSGVSLLAASPSFTGAVTVSRGALFVEDSDSLSAASALTVASGAFLKGSGGVSSAVIQAGGTIAPGHSPGCISAANITVSGTYLAQLGGTTACSGYDQIQASSAVTVSSGTLQLSLVNGFTPALGQSFTLINNSGSNPVTGTFAGLAEGAKFTSNGARFQISYQGGDGNDVVITVVGADATSGSSAPKSPNTGLAAIAAHPATTFLVSTAAALTMLAIARRLKPAKP